MLVAADYPFLDVLWTMILFFAWVAWIWIAITVFGDYHAEGRFSEANARAIRAKAEELPCRGQLDVVRLDPASAVRTARSCAGRSPSGRRATSAT